MGVVKYSGPVASFHCPTEATIRSLKVHFSPKQLGDGTPSPENVREIHGWDGITVEKSGKNLWGGSEMKEAIANNFPVISTDNNIITYSNSGAGQADGAILFSSLKPNTQYTLVLTYSKSTNVYTHIAFLYSDGSFTMHNRVAPDNPNTKTTEVYVSKANKTLTAIIRKADEYSNVTLYCDESGLFEGVITKSEFEPYRGETIDYEFGVLGKNKFPLQSTSIFLDQSTGWSNTNIRDMTTGDVFVNISSNNYWNGRSDGVYGISIGDGSVTYHAVNNSYGMGIFVPVSSNTEYTLSHAETAAMTRIGYYDSEGNHLNVNYSFIGTSRTFTTTADTVYILVVFATDSTGTEGDYTVSNIQLELGSTVTAYEPYNPNNTVYGGWVDLVTGEVCEEWYSVIVNGSEKWTVDGSGSNSRRAFTDTARFNQVAKPKGQLYGNYLVNYGSGIWYGWCSSTGSISSCHILMYIPVEYDTVDKWNAYLSENPLQLCYELRAPNTYQIAPIQLQTFLSRNNVWSNADYVEVEYDLHETQDILARKQFIVANQPHVEKLAPAPLQNFVTDMAAPIKECKVRFEPKRNLNGYNKPWIGGSGKNVFNPNLTLQNPSNTTVSPSTARIFTEGTYCVGTSWSNYYIPTNVYTYEVTSDHITVQNGNVYGVGVVCKLTSDETYSLSATTTNGRATVIFYDIDGTYISGIANSILGSNFTVPSNADITVINFYGPDGGDAATFTNIQLELGSTATSYVPYENICPISGWNGIEVNEAKKSLVEFKVEQREARDYYNGYNGWIDEIPANHFPTQTQLVYSVYLNCTNSTNEYERRAKIWIYQKQGTYRYALGNQINVGSSGVSVATITIQDTDSIIGFGLGISKGTIASQPIVELGSTATDYEPYNGTTIPITFPSEAGTVYGGYVDLVTGEVVQEYIIMEKTWGEFSIHGTQENTIRKYFEFDQDVYSSSQYMNVSRISNIMPYAYQWTEMDAPHFYVSNSRRVYMWLPIGTDDSTVVQVVGHLLNPVHYSLSSSQLKTLRGTNNIWSNANGNIELSYWKH